MEEGAPDPADPRSAPVEAGEGQFALAARIGLVAGPLVGAALLVWTHPGLGAHGGLGADACWTLGLLGWMAIWWMTQAVSLAVTSLLPILFFPLLGIGTFQESAVQYTDSVIFLFAGGTVLGFALERHGLSVRLTRGLLALAGRSPGMVVGALFASAAVISAFVSNTATTAMMLPMAIGVAASALARPGTDAATARRGAANFAIACLLAIAYGSTVGGVMTIIGSPPNAIAAKYLNESGTPVEFVEWASFGVPVALLVGPLAVMTLLFMLPARGIMLPPHGATPAPPMRAASWLTLAVFATTVFIWVTAPIWPPQLRPAALTDGGVAIGAAIALFMLPATLRPFTPLMDWSVAKKLPWEVFILFGGGLALAAAMQRTGLSQSIGQSFVGLASLPAPLVIGSVVIALVFASEIASNTALTATAVPILGAMAPALGLSPQQIVIPAAFGASYAFMLPVGTPPNAMVFATGRVPAGTMLRVGLVLNLLGAVVVTLLAWLLL